MAGLGVQGIRICGISGLRPLMGVGIFSIPTAFIRQVPAHRAPDPHLAGPGTRPTGNEDLAQPADSGDLSAEGTEGAFGASQEPWGEGAATVAS